MIDRIHDHTANRRRHPQPAHRAGLAEPPQVVLVVPHLADSGPAIDVYLADLPRLQAHARVQAFARRELGGAAGAARELAALADLELDVVHGAADRDVPQRQCVPGLDGGIGARADLVARLHALGREDVAPLAVLVEHEREVRGAVRIVFETLDDARNAVLVALEIDQPVALLVTAADVARGLTAGMVARTGAVLLERQRLEGAA